MVREEADEVLVIRQRYGPLQGTTGAIPDGQIQMARELIAV